MAKCMAAMSLATVQATTIRLHDQVTGNRIDVRMEEMGWDERMRSSKCWCARFRLLVSTCRFIEVVPFFLLVWHGDWG